MEAHEAHLSLGFSRQEHWSGLPFPSPSTQVQLLGRKLSSPFRTIHCSLQDQYNPPRSWKSTFDLQLVLSNLSLTYSVPEYIFSEKNSCLSGLLQLKAVLFKGQLYTKISHWGFLIFPLKFIYYFLQVLHMPPAPNTTKCVGRPPEPPLQSDPGFIPTLFWLA